MDEAAIERLPRFPTIRHDITALVEALAREAYALIDA